MKSVGRGIVRTICLAALLLGASVILAGPSQATHATTYQIGDVFVATGSGGTVQWRHPDGTFHAALATLPSVFTTGMAFDTSDTLYVTGFDGNQVSVLNSMGVLTGSFGSGYNADPESILFDAAGNAYVGQADGTRDILKFDAAGNLVTAYDVATSARGSDWIDLAADQCTMHYTSEGTEVKRFDVCTNTQLPDYAPQGTLPGSAAFALRLLLDSQGGGLLVADYEAVHRLDGAGAIAQTYDAPGENCWFALNLDPDAKSFWSADFCTSNVYKFDIATGSVLDSFSTGTATFTVFGLAVFGEITVSASTEGCKVTYGGRITAANGDKATFGGVAQVPAGDKPRGQEEYRDHGSSQPINVHSINVQALVCSADGTQAGIFGQATVDGSGTVDYRIDLNDLGEPGTSDTYRIRLNNGYDSGEQPLKQGNVQVHFP